MKKVLFFFESGRLGNQLFQYSAIRSQFPQARLVLFGLCSLRELFVGIDANIIACSRDRRSHIITYIIRNVLKFLGDKLNVISTIEDNTGPSATTTISKKGLIKGLYYCKDGWFQNERLLSEEVLSEIKINESLSEKADMILKGILPDNRVKVFVHMRRGDYLHWPSRQHPAVLPLAWFVRAMELQKEKYDNPLFLIFSDDKQYAKDVFNERDDVWISDLNESMDFALMARCDAGILSASSFSWWAAYFSHRNNTDSFFIAPTYWAGHGEGRWSTNNIQTSWLTYLSVKEAP